MYNNNTNEPKYSDAIQEIENLLREMQSDNCDIDKLAENTRRASQLIEICKQKLLRTEKEVQDILKNFKEE